MKTTRNISILFFTLIWQAQGLGQIPSLYRMAVKADNTYLTVEGSRLTAVVERTSENRLAQSFIIYRQPHGTVLVAYAGIPNLFLKRNGNEVVLADYADDPSYVWEVAYIGYPYAGLAEPGAESYITRQSGSWQMASGVVLADNDDAAGDDFRLTLETIENTF